MSGILRILLDLYPQSPDMYHDGVVCLVYFLVPYLLKDLVGAEHPAGIRCQKVQDIELDGRQLDLLAVDNDLVVIFIDGETTDRDLVLCRFL